LPPHCMRAVPGRDRPGKEYGYASTPFVRVAVPARRTASPSGIAAKQTRENRFSTGCTGGSSNDAARRRPRCAGHSRTAACHDRARGGRSAPAVSSRHRSRSKGGARALEPRRRRPNSAHRRHSPRATASGGASRGPLESSGATILRHDVKRGARSARRAALALEVGPGAAGCQGGLRTSPEPSARESGNNRAPLC